ncbi:beta(1,3)galactosyltransferase EpsH [Acidaminobacter sp. JC074]|uniref:PssE/Cps14G family polysaccharide biosynthesis glycosyltransferase n=1 Tax=Acidaminobacter sp. JC074 TaxID=2530199 RepID=UPI001F0D759B|nr:PssE/Cps14G family polysaccharide biosynthesis glycosyltransferase [Acidaminobacter sp. JC074]MCH4890651.1 beta(1,3)galactosyltransferase EpsH [Acidaminobacter sp. JC074]
MIFICLGTQIFQFNRLLIEVDKLIEEGVINEKVFAQVGKSDYTPINYDYVDYLDPDEYSLRVEESDLVITHGGTGAIVTALKANKKVIALPRLSKYEEHSDDHQTQIVEYFSNKNFILSVNEVSELVHAIKKMSCDFECKQFAGTGRILRIIKDYIGD